jgi:hypothetical protein
MSSSEKEIRKTLKYMESKKYKDVIANAQAEFKNIRNRDVEFFNMGKECFRGYVLRLLDEKIKECKSEAFAEADEVIGGLEEIKEVLDIKK